MSIPNRFETLIERFYHWEETTPDKVFLRQPKGDVWNEITWAEAGQIARRMVAALRAQGLQPGDHVATFSKNCAHWILADLAILMGGYVSVPFYSSLPGPQLKEVIELGDVKAIFIGKVDAWNDGHDSAIADDVISILFPQVDGSVTVPGALNWDQLVEEHEPFTENFAPQLSDLWTIKFTSGTTGTPKGVMHNHETLSNCMHNEQQTNGFGMFEFDDARYFSYLPLNHVAERVGVEMPAIWGGGVISFSDTLETFAKNIQEVQPTTFFAVPRIWTNFYTGITNKIPEAKLEALLSDPQTVDATKQQLTAGIGLGDVKVTTSGAAITPAFIKEFYRKLGINLMDGYGMTETCGGVTLCRDPEGPVDSVGKALPWGDVKIDPDTQEILMTSKLMMTGYYKNPEKTAEVLQDGWLKSGDRGTLDEDGYLRIVGRINDAFKTSKGSYVTPNPLEEELSENEYVEQICVVGLGIPQPIALLNLSPQGAGSDRAVVEASLIKSVDALNSTRAKFEHISTIVVQTEPWTVDNGCLTPTLKVKRFAFDERHAADYLNWHQASERVIWC